MTIVRQADLIESVAAALQFIGDHLPVDDIRPLSRAYQRERRAAAKDAIAQILTDRRLCAEGHRPICQHTEAIRRHRRAYPMAVGGAASGVSKAIRHAVVGSADLGMEAIDAFEVRDMPVTVAIDSAGTSVHATGTNAWRSRIAIEVIDLAVA